MTKLAGTISAQREVWDECICGRFWKCARVHILSGSAVTAGVSELVGAVADLQLGGKSENVHACTFLNRAANRIAKIDY